MNDTLNDVKRCENDDAEGKSTVFKGVEDRLVACNGDCGSKISKIIDCIVHHHKVML